MIQIKRAYETPSKKDGYRILVDRLWPRGLTKEKAAIDLWMKEIAPSVALRKWFNHDPAHWKEFQKKYTKELRENTAVQDMLDLEKQKKLITLVYGAKSEEINHASVLRNFLMKKKK